jgi:hypothetical protein
MSPLVETTHSRLLSSGAEQYSPRYAASLRVLEDLATGYTIELCARTTHLQKSRVVGM